MNFTFSTNAQIFVPQGFPAQQPTLQSNWSTDHLSYAGHQTKLQKQSSYQWPSQQQEFFGQNQQQMPMASQFSPQAQCSHASDEFSSLAQNRKSLCHQNSTAVYVNYKNDLAAPDFYENSSILTPSTEASSDDGSSSMDLNSEFNPFAQSSNQNLSVRKNSKNENGWKRKVKTELCKFWLNGMACENQLKEQGCGFAHGQEELQKKKGLSKQYMTSVCKNFLDHPSKCSYGQRCIFQHPTHDVRKRQTYTSMMQDNARYTAMRLFQEIDGADVIYINTYAATAPRLPVFRGICNSAKDNGEDYPDEEDYYTGTESANTSQENISQESADEDLLKDMLFMPKATTACPKI